MQPLSGFRTTFGGIHLHTLSHCQKIHAEVLDLFIE